MPNDTLLLCTLAGLTPLVVWKLLQHNNAKFVAFDAVPAPVSPSRIQGASASYRFWLHFTVIFFVGNMSQLFADDVWPFLDHLTNDFGPAVRLRGLFGVCIFISRR